MSYCDHLRSVICQSIPCLSTPLNGFSATPGPIFYFMWSPSWGLKICTDGHGLLIKMAAMTIYGKNTYKSSPEPRQLWGLVLVFCIELKVYQVCSNNDHRLTFDLFTARSNICPYTCIWGNVEKSFSQNVLKTNGLQCMI